MEMFISGLSSYFREGCVMVSKTELVIYGALFPQKQAIEMRQDRFQIRRTYGRTKQEHGTRRACSP
jgi:hypothetical protein